MTKITNNSPNPRAFVDKNGSSVFLPVGGTVDVEIEDGYLAVLKKDKTLAFGGKAGGDAAGPSETDWRGKLQAIADLFGDPAVNVDNVETAVKELLSGSEPGVSLADAVATLDHKNDKHWTQNGKPSLEYLAQATGAEVKRSDVDAFNVTRKL